MKVEAGDPRMDRYVAKAVSDMRDARETLMAALADVGPDDWQRHVPYGSRTLRDLHAHIATADHVWALAAKGLLKGESDDGATLTPAAAVAARERSILRARGQQPAALLAEMQRRRRLLLTLYELLESRHLALRLPAFGEQHNSVRERIWLGYHDRMHADDVRRALRMRWHPQKLTFLPQVRPAAGTLSPDGMLYVIYSVDPVNWEKPSSLPGWTFRMLLAHVATGDWVLQTHLRNVIEHDAIAPWPDVTAGNERLLAERERSTVGTLIEEYLSMRHESLSLMSRIKPRHLGLKMEFWWEPRPNEHTFLHYLTVFHDHDGAHAGQLRAAMKYLR